MIAGEHSRQLCVRAHDDVGNPILVEVACVDAAWRPGIDVHGRLRDRIYFIESKYRLLLAHLHDDAAIPRKVPFDIQSAPLP